MPNEQTIKLKLKTTHVEIEYEGSEDFLRSDLLGFITEVAEIHKANAPIGKLFNSLHESAMSRSASNINLSVKSIAAKLNVNTGSDLILAACAYLTLAENRETFSRKDILASMKDAASYYKQTYNKNLSNYLDVLIKDGKILHQANDVFALPDQVRNEMESKLVG